MGAAQAAGENDESHQRADRGDHGFWPLTVSAKEPNSPQASRSHWLGTLLLAGIIALSAADVGRTIQTLEGPSLTGQFLVATEGMGDPRFARTVIYLIRHDAHGAMGFVINRPLGELPLSRVLEQFGLDPSGVTGNILVYYGGPVDLGRGSVLHSSDYAGGQPIGDGIVLTVDRAILDAIAHGRGPARFVLSFGYAGWGPGQLEGEIARDAWITVSGDPALLFDEDNARKWQQAIARRRIDL